MREFDSVVLIRDLPEHEVRAGDVGVIVYTHEGAVVFEVEFSNVRGDTVAVATIDAEDIRLPSENEIVHVRRA
jgi:hypothetical protein